MTTFNGLPAHVLLVHFIVILSPLTAVLAIVCAVWPAARQRLVWLVLAIAVPFSVGLAVARNAPPRSPPESFAKRVLRGFPITIGLAAAFVIMFVSVPVMRFVALVRKEKSADIPVVTDTAAYHQIARRLCEVLRRHGGDVD